MPADSTAFARAVERLAERLAGVNPGWYAAGAGGRNGAVKTRADVLRALVHALAQIGQQAGTGAPAGTVPRDVGVHALADQIKVLAADISAAPGLTEALLERGTAQTRATYDALWI